MLTDFEIEWIREEFERHMPQELEVYDPGFAEDGEGGVTESETVLGTHAGRVDPEYTAAGEEATAGRVQSAQDWVITLPGGLSYQIFPKYRIRTTLAPIRVFEVVNPLAPLSFEMTTRVLCTEIV